MLMASGKITEKGVNPPEGCMNPMDVLKLATTSVRRSGGSQGFPIAIEHIDSAGKVQEIDPRKALGG